MNKSNRIFLLVIIILLTALVVMTFLYLNMRNTAKENVNQMSEMAEENSKLNARISELEEKNNISTVTNVTVPYREDINTSFVNSTISERINSIDTDKVTINVDKNTITPKSISIIITNNNENELSFSEEFKIQNKVNEEWKDLEYRPNVVWNAIAYIIKGNSQITKKLDIEFYYGELDSGIYRVVKSFSDGNSSNMDIYSNKFSIK